MAELPPLMRDQRQTDADHLRLLAIFHFVGAGLALLALGFLFLHYTLMHSMMDNPSMWNFQKNQHPAPPPQQFFAIFKWFYLVFSAWFLASAIGNLLSGLFITGRKHRTFSMVVAGINCLHIPLGTVLGVFTLVILQRNSVREAYETQDSV